MVTTGAPSVTSTLRYSFANFGNFCTDGWSSPSNYGRLCLTGTARPYDRALSIPGGGFCANFDAVALDLARLWAR